MPGHEGRDIWRAEKKRSPVPISLLLNQLYEKGAGLSEGFVIHRRGWPPVDILKCPLQKLKPAVTIIATSARTRASQGKRKLNENLYEIDKLATNVSNKRLPRDERGILRLIQQGAAWDRVMTSKTGYTHDDKCPHCGMIALSRG